MLIWVVYWEDLLKLWSIFKRGEDFYRKVFSPVRCQLLNKGKVTCEGLNKCSSPSDARLWLTALTDCIYDHFLLVLLTLMSLNRSRLSCQSRLLLCWQGSSLPPPWPPLCWSLSQRLWWLDRLAGVWSRLGSLRYVSMAITLSAIKIYCCRLIPLTVVIARAVFTVSIIHSVIITFPSGNLPLCLPPDAHEPSLVWKEP